MMSSAARRAPSHWYLGIDRRLPELPAAFDLPAVSRLYEARALLGLLSPTAASRPAVHTISPSVRAALDP